MSQELSQGDFVQLVKNGTLVSIDLLVWSQDGKLLLGRRVNEPAKGSFFVPGGRIRKAEKIEEAFSRIVWNELKIHTRFDEANGLGVYEHFYPTNGTSIQGFGTHYVVIAYAIHLDYELDIQLLPQNQHDEYKWFYADEAEKDSRVHGHVKKYLSGVNIGNKDQYAIVANRRVARDTMLWQTPALIFTAEAFLFQIIGTKHPDSTLRFLACCLGAVVAFAALQLFVRHRSAEEEDSRRLEKFEINNIHRGYAIVHKKHTPENQSDFCLDFLGLLVRVPSKSVWRFVLIINLIIFVILTTHSLMHILPAIRCFQ